MILPQSSSRGIHYIPTNLTVWLSRCLSLSLFCDQHMAVVFLQKGNPLMPNSTNSITFNQVWDNHTIVEFLYM